MLWSRLTDLQLTDPHSVRTTDKQRFVCVLSHLLVFLVCRAPRGPLPPPLPSQLPQMRVAVLRASPLCGLRGTISCSIPRESGGRRGGLLFLRPLLTWDSTQGQKPAQRGVCLTAGGRLHKPGPRKLHGTLTRFPLVFESGSSVPITRSPQGSSAKSTPITTC